MRGAGDMAPNVYLKDSPIMAGSRKNGTAATAGRRSASAQRREAALRRSRGRGRGPRDLTLDELRESAEELARRAGLSGANEAFGLLDAGKLDGTILETELRAIRFLARDRGLTTA
ncbi:MAG: hypothetical protein HY721_10915 [Planctomycetes bacterium]|nr:hypothetical protein [Planctomycetota bacterium]